MATMSVPMWGATPRHLVPSATVNPQEQQVREWMAALPTLGPLAQQFSAASESYAPNTEGWASPMLQGALPELMGQGMSSSEYDMARRNIGNAYRSAVGAGGFAGGSAGAFSPNSVRRLAVREAGQRLAPAISQLEAKRAEMRREGLRTGIGALSSIYPAQLQHGARQSEAFGGVLGNMLRGAAPGITKGPYGKLSYTSPYASTSRQSYSPYR